MLRPLLLGTSVLGFSILTIFGGCSSSTTNNNPGDGGGSDVSIKHDSSSSSGSSSGSSGDDSGGDSGGTCSADVAFTYTSYTTIVPSTTACTAADIKAFEAACTDTTMTAAACNAWQMTNTAGADGGGGTACGACIFGNYNPPMSYGQGAGYVTCDSTVTTSMTAACFFSPNVIGCVQLIDPTNGPKCAAADDALSQCEAWECNLCSDTNVAGPLDTACIMAADAAQCAQYIAPAQSACAGPFGDGGAGTDIAKCDPSGGTNSSEDFTFIIGLMCGGGTSGDSGVTDSGGGG